MSDTQPHDFKAQPDGTLICAGCGRHVRVTFMGQVQVLAGGEPTRCEEPVTAGVEVDDDLWDIWREAG